jgi:hypothetical protein
VTASELGVSPAKVSGYCGPVPRTRSRRRWGLMILEAELEKMQQERAPEQSDALAS